MRILVATTSTIPAFSGGWTTPLDLFGNEHEAMYLIRDFPPGERTIEGIKVAGVLPGSSLAGPFDRFRNGAARRLFRAKMGKYYKSFRADFVLCLDSDAGFQALYAGLPYALRFHAPEPSLTAERLNRLLSGALFATASPLVYVPGVEVLPHNQDLSRFTYTEHPAAERAVLLTTINPFREPELFIEGVMLSKNMKGDIVGTGEHTDRVDSMCERTGGRVRRLPPVPRLGVPALLRNYQVGVATIKKVPLHYQMKVNAYISSGLFTLAKPWTHIAVEAPELVRTFTTAEELASQLDYLEENWGETLETRRAANRWIHENYSVEIPRKRFREILANTF